MGIRGHQAKRLFQVGKAAGVDGIFQRYWDRALFFARPISEPRLSATALSAVEAVLASSYSLKGGSR